MDRAPWTGQQAASEPTTVALTPSCMAELTAAPPSDGVTRSPRFFLAIFCLIASVNYSDRGALNAVLTNAQAAMCLNAAEAGWLPSAFVVGYIAAAPVFAHLASTPVFEGKSFRLIAMGLCCFSIGSVSASCSGAAR